MEDSCVPTQHTEDGSELASINFSWSAKGIGFGSFYFFFKKDENGEMKLYCDNECMSKAFIKRMLNHMVDDAIMLDPNKKDSKDGKDGEQPTNDV